MKTKRQKANFNSTIARIPDGSKSGWKNLLNQVNGSNVTPPTGSTMKEDIQNILDGKDEKIPFL